MEHKYLVFAWDEPDGVIKPMGGMNDFHGGYPTLKDALLGILREYNNYIHPEIFQVIQVYDLVRLDANDEFFEIDDHCLVFSDEESIAEYMEDKGLID